MTATQIKTKIQRVLDNVPESALQDALEFLKEFQTSSAEEIRLTNNLRQILTEEKRTLGKAGLMIDIKRAENIHNILIGK